MDARHTTTRPSKERTTSPRWLAAGVAVGIILAPAAAVATGVGVTELAGSNGTRATVSRAGQLTTAPADPIMWRSFASFNEQGGSGCVRAYTAPPGYSFVLTDLELDTYADPTPGNGQLVSVDVDRGHGPCSGTLMDINPGSVGVTDVPITPGFVIPAGRSISTSSLGTIGAELFGQGYLVPSAAAPHQTLLALRAPGSSASAQRRPHSR